MTKFLKNKMRLDQYLFENEYFEDLEVAKKQIMAGNVIIIPGLSIFCSYDKFTNM